MANVEMSRLDSIPTATLNKLLALAEGGGGGGSFYATYTQNEETEEWTCDKTIQDLVSAYNSGANMLALVNLPDEIQVKVPLNSSSVISEGAAFDFYTALPPMLSDFAAAISITHMEKGGEETIVVERIEGSGDRDALYVSATSEPRGNNTVFTLDRTFEEISSAAEEGRVVVFHTDYPQPADHYHYLDRLYVDSENEGVCFVHFGGFPVNYPETRDASFISDGPGYLPAAVIEPY